MTGICACGCGEPTKVASKTLRIRGWVKGQPLRFINGHNRRRPVSEALGQFVQTHENDCWLWTGFCNRHGYGRLFIKGRHTLAHRAVYEERVGPIPDGLELDHLCRNRACVNPAHLEPVTHRENMRRARRNGSASRRREAVA